MKTGPKILRSPVGSEAAAIETAIEELKRNSPDNIGRVIQMVVEVRPSACLAHALAPPSSGAKIKALIFLLYLRAGKC